MGLTDAEIFIGFDSRERLSWNVCARSITSHSKLPPPLSPVGMLEMQARGLYTRATEERDGRLFDVISGAPMATEFAIARFFVPLISTRRWALFCDGDFMFRADVAELLALADDRYAVMVVQHDHAPTETVKMRGDVQTSYARKNWSSLIMWNIRHSGNNRLTLDELNTRRGLWLHQFGWLRDDEIGALPSDWNWLEGSSDEWMVPKAVHYTRGTPDMRPVPAMPYSQEWLSHATRLPAIAPADLAV